MLAAEDMTTLGEEEASHEALLGIDTVRQTPNRLTVALIDVGKRSTA